MDDPRPGAERRPLRPRVAIGGHALYIKDNRLHYTYNFLGLEVQKVVADVDVPTGEQLILSAAFDKDGEASPGVATGTLSLYHGDQGGRGPDPDPARQVLDRRRRPLRGPRQRRASHRRLSRRGAVPFHGGTIDRVAVDVSGEPYVDLEREAVAMMSRE